MHSNYTCWCICTVNAWLKKLEAGFDIHMGCLFALFLFKFLFYFFPIFSFLGSVSDGHFSEHQKWHLWLWWNYCQTIQTSRKTTIDDLFLYQLLISRYLHLSRLFNCSIVISIRQKVRLSITNAIKCPSLTAIFLDNEKSPSKLSKDSLWDELGNRLGWIFI